MNFGKLTSVARTTAGALGNVMGRLALSALSFNAHHATAADAPMTCTPANTEVAVRRLQAKVQEAQLYTAWAQAQCLQF